MRTTTALTLTSLALAPTLVTITSVSGNTATVEIADGDATNAVAASDVARRGNLVVGTLTNGGGDQIHDIRLLIEIPFLWANEAAPGAESPGRSTVMTVTGPLAPHGQLAFELTPNPPLPERTDGRYADPRVRVMGYRSVSAR